MTRLVRGFPCFPCFMCTSSWQEVTHSPHTSTPDGRFGTGAHPSVWKPCSTCSFSHIAASPSQQTGGPGAGSGRSLCVARCGWGVGNSPRSGHQLPWSSALSAVHRSPMKPLSAPFSAANAAAEPPVPECRICLQAAFPQQALIEGFCACNGTVRFAHETCIMMWAKEGRCARCHAPRMPPCSMRQAPPPSAYSLP